MRTYLKGKSYKRFNKFIASVITGNAGVPTTIFVVSMCALFLLAYVTTQIYSTVLSERIAVMESQQLIYREKIHTLTGQYTELASRELVAGYCENNLGMVEAGSDNLRRIAIEGSSGDYPEFGEFAVKRSFVSEVVGQTVQGTNRRK
ncbi:MAG: hypothetical protein ABIA59_07620 [Candidatus Latescibacterota bacterium]